jgi:hypothetical protein
MARPSPAWRYQRCAAGFSPNSGQHHDDGVAIEKRHAEAVVERRVERTCKGDLHPILTVLSAFISSGVRIS